MKVYTGLYLWSTAQIRWNCHETVTSVATITMKVVNWLWLRPKKYEKLLKDQGFHGNPYRLLRGDMLEFAAMAKENRPKQIKLSDNVSFHALPYIHSIIKKYGKKAFIWFGPTPSIQVINPEQIREIMSKPRTFHKMHPNPLGDMILGGLISSEDTKWSRDRKIMNPAFHLAKLKIMLPEIHQSCDEMIKKWETLVLVTGSAEIDVWPSLEDLSGDVISRTAFGSNYEEGRRIFNLQKEQVELTLQLMKFVVFPGWRYLPIKANKRMKTVCNKIQILLRGIISKRQEAMKVGEIKKDDLLGLLLQSNSEEIKENGIGMDIEEVMQECKLFYFAGSETTSNLLVWTLIMLSTHPEWQTRAREEVVQAFGSRKPDFDGLNHLKIVTMVLQEVLRLYPPASMLTRSVPKDAKLGNINLSAGMIFTVPVILLHHDPEIWGKDSLEFKPERFSEGVSSATKGKYSYIPFGGGPRICIGQNLAMVEAKVALAMILQRFRFQLSPSYVHAPFPILTLQPQHGASLILHQL
ncbi:cytochrome P450 CYP72A219-like isoform X2 [Apium graveolens]|uniref:cytochrome P450 CYP72A219-like isoform X2 n=1 Tax=Apium graveolens TaxID=4045 RepID=UPI003D7AAD25